MTSKQKPTQSAMSVAVNNIQDVLDSVPSSKERAQIQKSLTSISDMVERVRASLDTLPDPRRVNAAIRKLEDLTKVVNGADSSISPNGNHKVAKKTYSGNAPLTQDERDFASATVAELREIPSGELRDFLGNRERYSVRQLRAIASKFGLPPSAKYNRDALINHIAVKISNLRGYHNILTGAHRS